MTKRYKTASPCPSGCGSIVCHFHGDTPPDCDRCRDSKMRHPGNDSPSACTCGTRGLHRADCPARGSIRPEPGEARPCRVPRCGGEAKDGFNTCQTCYEAGLEPIAHLAIEVVQERRRRRTQDLREQHRASERQRGDASTPKPADPGAHYRHSFRLRLSEEDIERGFVEVKLDPYRICRTVGIQGGPHEHATKKLLRGETKGHEERELIREVRACLDRWEEMLEEDASCP